jgi:GT2 family glycosyltransferase
VSDALLSVVVCTHNRPRELERCLAALAALRDPVEVIVVDSASDPPCRALVDGFAGSVPNLRYRYEPEPGLSRARNIGVHLAGCDLVAFVDDDAAVAPDWAGRLAAAFADPAIGCVGGTCRPRFQSERPPWLSDRLLQFAGITRFGSEAREARSRAEYPFGANMCFRREALLAAGGFPERLGRVGSALLSNEDSAAIDAVRARGWQVWLEPGAVVDHVVDRMRCRSRYYWRRLWWQGISRARAGRSGVLALRLLAAVPVRLCLWPLTRDRFYLYRTAETAGYLAGLLRRA